MRSRRGRCPLRAGPLDSFTFKFDKPGTYKYLCTIHPRMMAAIIVK